MVQIIGNHLKSAPAPTYPVHSSTLKNYEWVVIRNELQALSNKIPASRDTGEKMVGPLKLVRILQWIWRGFARWTAVLSLVSEHEKRPTVALLKETNTTAMKFRHYRTYISPSIRIVQNDRKPEDASP